MKRYISLFAAALFVATPGIAGSASLGAVYGVTIIEGTVVLFNTTGARYNPPTNCPAPLNASRFAIPANTDAGKAMITALVTAQARGERVFLNGTGNCNTWGDCEGVNDLQIED